MKSIQLWDVTRDGVGQSEASVLNEVQNTETEALLEDLLVATPSLLMDELRLIGRQVPTEGGPLDLLGIDESGRLVVFELKRGQLTRDAVAQVLDYASDLAQADTEVLTSLIENHSGRNGIDQIDDFNDWYASEFSNAGDQFSEDPRMVLVGLGVDDRARRIVNYLADSGIDIQLLTFHAFESEGRLFLARQVETKAPTKRRRKTGLSKEDYRAILHSLAEEQGVLDLLTEVTSYIEGHLPTYTWPGKTAYAFSLQGRTPDGAATQHTYLTLYVDRKERGRLRLFFRPHSYSVATEALSRFAEEIPEARLDQGRRRPVVLEFDANSWPRLQEALGSVLTEVREGWTALVAEDGDGSDV